MKVADRGLPTKMRKQCNEHKQTQRDERRKQIHRKNKIINHRVIECIKSTKRQKKKLNTANTIKAATMPAKT